MTAQKRCPKCSTALPPNAPEALCAACLVELALESPGESAPEGESIDESVRLLRKFGEFELLERLGSGGMGVVYRARQPRLNRLVALKLVRSLDSSEQGFAERFQIEARAAAALDHPNIVPVFESGEVDGQPYIAMRLIEGRSLDLRLRAQAMEPRAAAQLLHKVARAVHYAHQLGVLHRDLKPGNVLVDEEGEPHLTDFGLARLVQSDSSLTSTMASLGTPSYMSPEQAAGGTARVTTAGDVYGLGAILFEALTGMPPFAGSSAYETVRQVIEQEPRRPSLVDSRIPRDLDTISLKCLEKEPQRRYASAREVAEDLRRWLDHEPILARPVTVPERIFKWMRRNPLLAVLLSLIAIGAAGFVWEQHRSSKELRAQRDQSLAQQRRAESVSRRLRFEEADRRLQDNRPDQALALFAQLVRQDPSDLAAANRIVSLLTHRNFALLRSNWLLHSGRLNSVDVHPEGRRLLVASVDGWLKQWNLETGAGEPLPARLRATRARYNRAGTKMISVDDSSCHVTDLAGTGRAMQLKAEGMAVRYAEFSPDGLRALTSGLDGVCRIWDLSDGRLVYSLVHGRFIGMARFDPTGSQVASVSSDGVLKVVEFAPDGPRVRQRAMASEQTTICWSPDGEQLAAQDVGYENISLLNAKTLEPVLGPLRHAAPINNVEFDKTGARLVTASDDRTARVWDARTGLPITEPLPHPAPVKDAQFSPDGARVITACEDGRIRVWDVVDGRIDSPALAHPRSILHAAFSPDGRWIATVSKDQALRLWNAHTATLAHPPIPHANPLHSVTFSPDSLKVVVVEGVELTDDLRVVGGQSALVYDVASGEQIRSPLSHSSRVLTAQFDPGITRVLTGSADGTARLWSLDRNHPAALCVLGDVGLAYGGKINSARLSPDGTVAVLAFEFGRAEVWNIENLTAPRLEASLPHDHSKAVRWADFDSTGDRVLTASDDHTARIWSRQAPAHPLAVLPHDHIVHGGYFSADGRKVVTFSVDKTARLWDAATGKMLGSPMRHNDQVWSAQFSPEGARVVTVTWQGEVRLWDVPSALALTEPIGGGIRRKPFVSQPDNARFSPDGLHLLCLFADRTARLVEIPRFPGRVPLWLADLAEAVGGQRIDENGRTEAVPAESLLSFSGRAGSVQGNAAPDAWQTWLAWFFADRRNRSRTVQ